MEQRKTAQSAKIASKYSPPSTRKMADLKNQIEKIDQDCKNARQLLEKALQKTNDELREEIKVNNEALRQELIQNLKEEISKEVGNEL